MIGANLARAYLDHDYSVFILSRPGADHWRLTDILDRIQVLSTDYRSSLDMLLAEARPDIILHLASTPFNPPGIPAEEHFEANVGITIRLLEAVRNTVADCQVITAGSCAAYGEGENLKEDKEAMPHTVLGAAKQSARVLIETYARLYGLKTLNLCLFTPYGAWESAGRLIPHIILSALRSETIRMTEGRQQRDFLLVDDVVDAFLAASETDVPGGTTINICSGQPLPVRDLARLLLEITGLNVELELGALPTRSDEIQVISGDNARAKEILDWYPRRTLEQGLEQSVEWFKQHRHYYE